MCSDLNSLTERRFNKRAAANTDKNRANLQHFHTARCFPYFNTIVVYTEKYTAKIALCKTDGGQVRKSSQ